jgi:hypothetical protein
MNGLFHNTTALIFEATADSGSAVARQFAPPGGQLLIPIP